MATGVLRRVAVLAAAVLTVAACDRATAADSWGRVIEVPGLGALNKGRYAEVTSVSCGSAGTQLLEVGRGWRDMKQVIDLRPVYHRKEEQIRAHIILCRLALLLIRITETTTRATWPFIRPRPRADHAGHLHRPSRHLPPAHRAHQDPARHPRPAQDRTPAEDLPAHHRNALTRQDTTA